MEKDETLETVKTTIELQLKKMEEETIKPLLGKQDEEIKKYGKSTEETGAALSEAGKKLDSLLAEHAELKKALEGQSSKIGDLEEEVKKRQRPGWEEGGEAEFKTPGTLFTEYLAENASLLEALKRTQGRIVSSTDPFGVKRMNRLPKSMERKAVVTADVALQPIRLPGILDILGPRLQIRDLMPSSPIGPPGLATWVEETGFFSVATQAVTSITRSGAVATVTMGAAHGYRNGDRIQIAGATQTEYNKIAKITVTGATTFTYAVSGTPATPATTSTAITANRMNNFGAAAFVAEGAAKPEAGMKLTEKSGRAEVIAHWLTISRAALDDLPGLRSQIDNRLLTGLDYKEEMAILYGTGTTPDVQGIMTHPDVQTYAWSDGEVGDNKMDAIRRAITRVQLAFMTPTGAVVSPLDSEDIDTAKGNDDHYIWVQSPAQGGVSVVWRLPLVVTPSIVEGDFLVGAFAEGGEIRDREEGNIRFSDQHASNFTSNLLVILAEKRMLPIWYRPEAFVAGEFDSAPVEAP